MTSTHTAMQNCARPRCFTKPSLAFVESSAFRTSRFGRDFMNVVPYLFIHPPRNVYHTPFDQVMLYIESMRRCIREMRRARS